MKHCRHFHLEMWYNT